MPRYLKFSLLTLLIALLAVVLAACSVQPPPAQRQCRNPRQRPRRLPQKCPRLSLRLSLLHPRPFRLSHLRPILSCRSTRSWCEAR